MSESEIRQEIKNHLEELLTTGRFEEYHELVSSKADWEEERKALENKLDAAFESIEADNYEEAIKMINKTIMKLGAWKTKLSKIV